MLIRMTFLMLSLAACVAVLASPVVGAEAAPYSLEGRWLLGEADGDDFDVVMDFRGLSCTLSSHRATATETPRSYSVRSVASQTWVLEPPSGTEDPVYVVLRSPVEGFVWKLRSPTLHWMRRVAPAMPAELMGNWKVLPSREGQPSGVSFTAESVTFARAEGAEAWPVYPLVSATGELDVVIAPTRGESDVWHLQPIGAGAYIMWEHEHSGYRVLFREGKRPSWLLEPREGGETKASTPR